MLVIWYLLAGHAQLCWERKKFYNLEARRPGSVPGDSNTRVTAWLWNHGKLRWKDHYFRKQRDKKSKKHSLLHVIARNTAECLKTPMKNVIGVSLNFISCIILTYLNIYKTCVYYITISLYNGIQKKVNWLMKSVYHFSFFFFFFFFFFLQI